MNIPDGEVYTAPVRDSINGVITYNAPSICQGTTFENIRLEFRNGKIVNATANNTGRLNEILDTDEGARYVGEFAIGELAQLASLYDGRIIIIDQDFRVIKDTYGLIENKYVVSEEVIRCFKGESQNTISATCEPASPRPARKPASRPTAVELPFTCPTIPMTLSSFTNCFI